MSHQDVASVSCGCCKSSFRCFSVVDVDLRCCNYLFSNVADVATLFSVFFMLQTLILDVADAESRCLQTCVVGCCKHCFSMLQTLRFDVADMWCLGVVLRRRGERLLMLDVARNTGRNMAAI
jgi:hypothetical protein